VRQGRFGILVVVAALAMPVSTRAQSLPPPPSGPVEDPAETARVRLGPLFLQPEFGLKDVGLDNNVYNDPADPTQDWTATLGLGMLAGLRFGPARLTVRTSTDYIWYARETTERAIDGLTRYQFEVRTPRLRPWIAYEKAKTHERPNFEVDARAGRTVPTYEAGVEFKIGFRLSTRLIALRRAIEYQTEETFRGVQLSEALDADLEMGAFQLLYEISPLSSLRASVEGNRTRFDTAKIRDADDIAAYLGIEGRRDAGIEGNIDVGWMQRTPRDSSAPAYSGLVARGSAAVILAEQVRVAFALDRNMQWSYEQFYTFYVQSGGSTTVTWRPHQRLDLVATGRHYWMEYEDGLDARAVARVDKLYGYGGGIGVFVRGYPGTRLGLNVERATRESVIEGRGYDGLRYYTQVGFSF
jgi:hypothetical protein